MIFWYQINKEKWSTGIKFLIIQNTLTLIGLGMVYGAFRITSILENTNHEYDLQDVFYIILIYLAPNVVLLLATVKLSSVNVGSKEIYVGVMAVYTFIVQLVYLIDLELDGSPLVFIPVILVPISSIYVIFFDKKTKELLSKLNKE